MFRLGRNPRKYDPRIPHLSALMGGRLLTISPPPPSVDWSANMPQDFGVMRNDSLGCCIISAFYHSRQIWSFNTESEITDPDSDVISLYEKSCGYNPDDPHSDQGGNEQDVLNYLVNTGAPVGDGSAVDKLIAFVEVDVRNITDIKTVINECGVCYIGINMPQALMDNVTPVWGYNKGDDTTSAGGHAVILCGYNADGPFLISWGSKYQMTWSFFSQYVDEAYALADNIWFESNGNTLLGLNRTSLETLMVGIKESQ